MISILKSIGFKLYIFFIQNNIMETIANLFANYIFIYIAKNLLNFVCLFVWNSNFIVVAYETRVIIMV